jgi:hypothetical protein
MLGHEVILFSSGDHFKKFDSDYSFHPAFYLGIGSREKSKMSFINSRVSI